MRWIAELEAGSFAGSADDQRDGFIHLSTAAQLTATVDRHFASGGDLHVAEVDLEAAIREHRTPHEGLDL